MTTTTIIIGMYASERELTDDEDDEILTRHLSAAAIVPIGIIYS